MMREGYRTVRVTNADVMQNLEGVLTKHSMSAKKGPRGV
jgi:very-short-patch-repair endonuclease